jgi:hypothetical protein
MTLPTLLIEVKSMASPGCKRNTPAAKLNHQLPIAQRGEIHHRNDICAVANRTHQSMLGPTFQFGGGDQ